MKFRSISLVLMSTSLFTGVVYTQSKEAQVAATSSSCGIRLKVTGGQFSPGVCSFEIISGGAACKSAAGCDDYALSLKDGEKSHIRQVVLFNFSSFEKRTFRFNAAQNVKEFNGQVIDELGVARNLTEGEVSLEPIAGSSAREQKVRVLFEVAFSNSIRIQGSGEVPVKHVSAP